MKALMAGGIWRGQQVSNVFLLGAGIGALVLIGIALVKLSNARRRKAHQQILERYYQSRQALVRYIMLKHQCSEEAAYQRIATFVKMHSPSEHPGAIDRALISDRQSLLDRAHIILLHEPDEIDRI